MGTQTPSVNKKQDTDQVVRVLLMIVRPVIRSAIKQDLSGVPGIEIVGEVADWQECQMAFTQLRPHVTLVGIVMLTRFPSRTTNSGIGTPMLALVPEALDAYLSEAMDAGASGYVLEDADPIEIATALQRVATRQVLWTREDQARVRRWQEAVGQRWRSLTEREREVLRLLAKGMDTPSVANAMAVTPKTVEHHVGRILDKLALVSRMQAVVWYLDGIPPDFRGGGGLSEMENPDPVSYDLLSSSCFRSVPTPRNLEMLRQHLHDISDISWKGTSLSFDCRKR